MGQNTTGDNSDLKSFYEWVVTPEGQDWAAFQSSGTSSPAPLGGTTNEEYIAAKLAQDAAQKYEADWYRSVRGTGDDPYRYNPRNNQETGYYYDRDGNFGLGILPEQYYYNDALGAYVEGTAGWAGSPGSDLSLGGTGGGSPATAPQAGDDVFTNPFPDANGGNGRPNGGIPEGYLPDSNGNSYWDYVHNGGTVRPPAPPPYVPPTGGGGGGGGTVTPPTGGGGGGVVTPPTGGGGGTGGGGIIPPEFARPPLHGYESSTNKDFYQKQFQEMHGNQNLTKLGALAAAIKQQEAANAPATAPFGGDPWSWTNLPTVRQGGSNMTTPIEWGLNQNYGINPNMTNQQAVGAIAPVLNADELAMMTKHWQQAPQIANDTNWVNAGGPQALIASLGNVSPEFGGTLQKVFNNIYTQTGGGSDGMNVPAGYAAPVNV